MLWLVLRFRFRVTVTTLLGSNPRLGLVFRFRLVFRLNPGLWLMALWVLAALRGPLP